MQSSRHYLHKFKRILQEGRDALKIATGFCDIFGEANTKATAAITHSSE
jgi:hypothetical protein